MSVILNAAEVEAKDALKGDMQILQDARYKLRDDELQTLVDEDLLTEEELKAITIVK